MSQDIANNAWIQMRHCLFVFLVYLQQSFGLFKQFLSFFCWISSSNVSDSLSPSMFTLKPRCALQSLCTSTHFVKRELGVFLLLSTFIVLKRSFIVTTGFVKSAHKHVHFLGGLFLIFYPQILKWICNTSNKNNILFKLHLSNFNITS